MNAALCMPLATGLLAGDPDEDRIGGERRRDDPGEPSGRAVRARSAGQHERRERDGRRERALEERDALLGSTNVRRPSEELAVSRTVLAGVAGEQYALSEVIPLLQRRGLFRTEYTGTTLREHYGLPWPASAFDDPNRRVELQEFVAGV